jgi:hypothetical protein
VLSRLQALGGPPWKIGRSVFAISQQAIFVVQSEVLTFFWGAWVRRRTAISLLVIRCIDGPCRKFLERVEGFKLKQGRCRFIFSRAFLGLCFSVGFNQRNQIEITKKPQRCPEKPREVEEIP